MSAIIQFGCRTCEAEISIPPLPANQAVCPACGKHQEIRVPADLEVSRNVRQCVACGHEDFYVQKDFNRQAGLIIVGIGVLSSTYFFDRRLPLYAMAALVVTALIDLVIYAVVPMVTVCYSCHAIYRDFNRTPEHEVFDLKKLEKFGGRTPRW